MQIKQTKNGKLHLEGCKVLKNKAIQIKAEVGPEAASKIPEYEFCKVCFGRSPYTKITEMILALPVTTPEPDVEAKVISPEPAPRRVKIEPKPEPKVSVPAHEVVTLYPIEGTDRDKLEVIKEMMEKLEAFSKDTSKSNYKRFKASYYLSSLQALALMIQTGDATSINLLIDRLQ